MSDSITLLNQQIVVLNAKIFALSASYVGKTQWKQLDMVRTGAVQTTLNEYKADIDALQSSVNVLVSMGTGGGSSTFITLTDAPTAYTNAATKIVRVNAAGTALEFLADRLWANTTVSFTSGMSAAMMQALIDTIPKNLGGYTATFAFGSGTYTTSAAINFQNFYNGVVNINGITGDSSTRYTTQSVIINSSANGGIYISSTNCIVNVNNIQIACSYTGWSGIFYARDNGGKVNFNCCYAIGVTGQSHYGYILYGCAVSTVQECAYKAGNYALFIYGQTTTIVNNNASVATIPVYGSSATEGSTIIKRNATNFTGSTAAEAISDGGLSR